MNQSEFLQVKSGDNLLIGEQDIVKFFLFVSASRDLDTPTIFKVENFKTGEIKYVNADENIGIVAARKG